MNRRSAIKDLLVASGGWITLPLWMTACRIADKDAHFSSFSPAEQASLATFVDILIPAGPAIGALSLGVDKFLQKVLDDCYEKPVVDNVKKQLAALGGKYSPEILQQALHSPDAAIRDCFVLLKNETIRGFSTSQQVMEGYLHYKVAPGDYYGCVTLPTTKL